MPISEDFSKAIDKRCGSSHNIQPLSIFSTISTSILMLLSIPLNALVVFILIKDRKQKRYKSLFYKLLLNIAIADLLTGLVTDPISVIAIIKEIVVANLSEMEIYFAHLSLFFTDAVALCTLTLLSVDRTIAIVCPIKHFQGVKPTTKYLLLVSTWIVAFCLVLPYFELDFIRQLLFFSSINIGATILSLLVTIVMYKLRLKPRQRISVINNQVASNNELQNAETSFNTASNIQSSSSEASQKKTENIDDTSKINIGEINNERICIDSNSLEESSTKIKTNTKVIGSYPLGNSLTKISKKRKVGGDGGKLLSKKQTSDQQRATRSFFTMLCVFLASYLPTAITMILMNTCITCSCTAVHVMRDVSIVSILSSSVFRPLNFILTLKHLRTSVFYKLGIKKSRGVNSEITSGLSTGSSR